MEEAIRIVRRLYPRLAIAGNRADDFTLADEATITDAIDATRPDCGLAWAWLPHNPSRCATATGCVASA
jgi:hypothetical protein